MRYKEIISEFENDEENNDNGYNEILIPLIKYSVREDEEYKVDQLTFGPIPNFDIVDRMLLSKVNKNNTILWSNSFDVYEEGPVEIFQPFDSCDFSLEKCKMVGDMLKCEVYSVKIDL